MLPCTGSTLIWTLSKFCCIGGCIADVEMVSLPTSTSVKPSFNADCMGLRSDRMCSSGCIFLEIFPLCPSSIGIRGTRFALHLASPRKEAHTNRQPRVETDSLQAGGWERRRELSGSRKHIRRDLCPSAVPDRKARSDFEPKVLSKKPDR